MQANAQLPEYELPETPELPTFNSSPPDTGPSSGPTTAYLNPFPIVRLAGRITPTGARITLLRVKAPPGSKVTVRCRGGRKLGCPYRSRSRVTPRSRYVRYRSLEHLLRARTVLQVFVRDDDTIGKYTRFKIRKRKVPSRKDLCTFPDEQAPRECP